MNQRYGVVIVGAGHAGAQVAAGLRQHGFDGSVAIVGEELELPYERPPLTKEYLADQKSFDRILLRPKEFWSERDITILRGQRVVLVNSSLQKLWLNDGSTLRYDTLVWATGGSARPLACTGAAYAGVHTVRFRADVDRIKRELPSARNVVVVGGGYIGLESAAVLTKLNKKVTVIETASRVLSRVAGGALSDFLELKHRAEGVDFRLATSVTGIDENGGRAAGVRLSTGELLLTDLVIVGIGIVPAVEPLLAAGADGGNGVLVDSSCRTTLPNVFAAGDCALHLNPFAGGKLVRLESVQNANDQANVVVGMITGAPSEYHSVPWFWSNQYDLRLQSVGLSIDYDDEIVRGHAESGSFSVVYLRDEKVVALDCVNATKDYVQGKALISAGVRAPRADLENPAIPLKALLSH